MSGSDGEVSEGVTASGRMIPGVVHTTDGRERTFNLYVPSTAGDDAIPLLVALHGGLGWGLQFRDNSGFDRLAEANGFMVVFPDGTRILRRRPNSVWNGGACCGKAAEQDIDDVTFISELMDELIDNYAIDESRVYVTGHSNGAIMSYRLACELSDKVVAVAFQAGSLEVDDCSPIQAVSVMNLHGLDDTNIPIEGGPGDGPSGHSFASPMDSVKRLADLNGCKDRDTFVDGSNDDVSGWRFTGCTGGASVEMVTVRGANHAWMGHRGSFVQRLLTGEAYEGLDASLVIWKFLSQISRP